jgi:hypothetical protein
VPVFFGELQAAMHSVRQSILQFKTSGAELNPILMD